jgi:NADH:ubiquinone oxidoreductase subunit 5 (subunit L)/multisubunit Na+/H+ antiporter MnhA subunit
MEQPEPLTPQEIAAMQAAQYGETGQPQTVKVFGILHVIMGAYGVFGIIIGILAMAGINPFLAFMPKTPEAVAQMEQQAAMQKEMIPVSVISIILTIAITFLILRAGILMLKRRRSGLKWSNRYAWVSLVGKVFGVVVAVIYTFPMIKGTIASTPGAKSMPAVMESVMIVSMIIGVLIPFIYPILTLVLLNRPATKEWFANRTE